MSLFHFHRYIAVDDREHMYCGDCFDYYELCPHSIKVCTKCGNFVGYGSHGRLSVIPDGCVKQVEHIRRDRV